MNLNTQSALNAARFAVALSVAADQYRERGSGSDEYARRATSLAGRLFATLAGDAGRDPNGDGAKEDARASNDALAEIYRETRTNLLHGCNREARMEWAEETLSLALMRSRCDTLGVAVRAHLNAAQLLAPNERIALAAVAESLRRPDATRDSLAEDRRRVATLTNQKVSRLDAWATEIMARVDDAVENDGAADPRRRERSSAAAPCEGVTLREVVGWGQNDYRYVGVDGTYSGYAVQNSRDGGDPFPCGDTGANRTRPNRVHDFCRVDVLEPLRDRVRQERSQRAIRDAQDAARLERRNMTPLDVNQSNQGGVESIDPHRPCEGVQVWQHQRWNSENHYRAISVDGVEVNGAAVRTSGPNGAVEIDRAAYIRSGALECLVPNTMPQFARPVTLARFRDIIRAERRQAAMDERAEQPATHAVTDSITRADEIEALNSLQIDRHTVESA